MRYRERASRRQHPDTTRSYSEAFSAGFEAGKNRERREWQQALIIAMALACVVGFASSAMGQCYGGVCPSPAYNSPSYGSGRTVGPVTPAPAQASPLPRQQFQAVARIVHHEQGGQSLGTGTLIADDREASHFLTCAHLFTAPGTTEVRLGGKRLPVQIIALDRGHDLALLRGPPAGVTPVEAIANQPSGTLTAGGFGPRGVPRFIRGRVRGFTTARGASSPSVVIGGAVRSGDSGGPVFDESGRVVAVVWGSVDGESYAMGGAPLRRLLSRLPRVANRPAGSPPGDRRLTPIEREPATPKEDKWRKGVDTWRQSVDNRPDQLANQKPPELPKDLVRTSDLAALSGRLDGFERSLSESQTSQLAVLAKISTRLDRFERPQGVPPPAVAAPLLADPLATAPLAEAPAFDPLLRPIPATPTDSKTSSAEWLLSKLGSLGAIGTALGVGGPVGVAAWFGARWLSRRRDEPRPRPAPTVVAVDTPPPPQQVVPETHYVPYEKDDYAKAHQWASEQTVRKYPGAVEILTSLDSLIDQKLNAKRPA